MAELHGCRQVWVLESAEPDHATYGVFSSLEAAEAEAKVLKPWVETWATQQCLDCKNAGSVTRCEAKAERDG